jgi:hypothetical protein
MNTRRKSLLSADRTIDERTGRAPPRRRRRDVARTRLQRRQRGVATAPILLAKRKRPSVLSAVPGPWTDLEQAFFDSAPPDEPEPPAEPFRLDDRLSPSGARVWPQRASTKVRLILDGSARVLEGPTIWVVLATVSLIVGLWSYSKL